MIVPASALGAVLLLVAAVTDVKRRIIPNRIVIFVALAGIFIRSAEGSVVLFQAVAAAGAIFFAMLILFHFGMVGGGDVKLLAAAALLAPPGEVGSQLVLTAFAGGGLAILSLLWQQCLRILGGIILPCDEKIISSDRTETLYTAERPKKVAGFEGEGLPYGVAICIGALANMAMIK